MTKRRFFMVILITLFATTTLAKGKSIKEVFVKNLNTRITSFKKKIKDLKIIADVKIYSPKGTIKAKGVLYMKGPYQRQDIQVIDIPMMGVNPALFANMHTITLSTPKGVWSITPIGKMKVSKNNTAKQPQMDISNWMNTVIKYISSVKKVKKGKHTFYEVTLKNSGVWHKAVFRDDMALSYVSGTTNIHNKKTKIEFFFSDFNPIAKLPFPHKLIMKINGVTTSEFLIKKLQVNKGLPDSLFDPDKVSVPGPAKQ